MDASTYLSPNFVVGDLIKTSTGIANLPSDDYLPNLKALAHLLELLLQVDDFTIESGFRSPAVNAAVGGADASYHSDGLAADIIPSNMSAEVFWKYIHNTPRLRNAVGEYAWKPTRNTPNVHVSTPTAQKVAFDLIETSPGVYVRSNVPYDDSYILDFGSAPMYLGLALGLGLILFAVYKVRHTA